MKTNETLKNKDNVLKEGQQKQQEKPALNDDIVDNSLENVVSATEAETEYETLPKEVFRKVLLKRIVRLKNKKVALLDGEEVYSVAMGLFKEERKKLDRFKQTKTFYYYCMLLENPEFLLMRREDRASEVGHSHDAVRKYERTLLEKGLLKYGTDKNLTVVDRDIC